MLDNGSDASRRPKALQGSYFEPTKALGNNEFDVQDEVKTNRAAPKAHETTGILLISSVTHGQHVMGVKSRINAP